MVRNDKLRAQKTLVLEQNRISQYFPESVKKKVASNYSNLETQRDILLLHVEDNHPGMASLFNSNYYKEIDTFIESIENKYPDLVEKSQLQKFGIKQVSLKKTKKVERFQLITSKTKNGVKYSRTKSKPFENKKVAVSFIKLQTKKGKKNNQITEDYNKLARKRGWQLRTVSSITTLKSRSKIKK